MKRVLLLFLVFGSISVKAQVGNLLIPTAKELGQLVGKVDTIYGTVTGVMHLKTPGLTLMMIGDSFPNQPLTVVIKDADLKNFRHNPERAYIDNLVKIVGKIELYQGKLQINVKDSTAFQPPSKIKIIGHDRPE